MTLITDEVDQCSAGMILSVNPGHDGAVAVVKDRQLVMSLEAEHNSFPRHLATGAYHLLAALRRLDEFPSVIALSGWPFTPPFQSASTPYYGIDSKLPKVTDTKILGTKVRLFESTHERAHIFASYGLSPFEQGQPCYVLTWEGSIGSFYEIDESLNIKQHGPVMHFPGYKYSFLFDLADPKAEMGAWRLDNAGKLMALAAFAERRKPNPEEQQLISTILEKVVPPVTNKMDFAESQFFNCGVTDPQFRQLVALFSDNLFNVFYSFAKQNLRKRYPLLVSGGCGLNCEWNSRWRDCGLFEDIFVPPVANDTGTAIGTAVEAQYAVSGNAKISWTVYGGSEFVMDRVGEGFTESHLNCEQLANMLYQGSVIAWVQGRCEIGPRALGNRSLLAAPFDRRMTDRLNAIKQREWYRPIAPVCLEEDAELLFGNHRPSPFMLFFDTVRNEKLAAVTHIDGTARVQTVSRSQNAMLYDLLVAFRQLTGFGVLCNTSLNLKGRGFINTASDLFAFVTAQRVDAVVIGNRLFVPTRDSQHGDLLRTAASRSFPDPEPS